MSLAAWKTEFNVHPVCERGIVFIHGSDLWESNKRRANAARMELFGLTDYYVSSNSGGCFILCPR